MEQSRFIQLKTIPIYTKTIVMLSAMSDEKIAAIIKGTAQYFVGSVSPFMDDPVSQMLVNEICECIDKAEEKKSLVEKSLIRDGKEYEANQESFDDHSKSAKTSRNIAIGTLAAGGILLGFGLVLSF